MADEEKIGRPWKDDELDAIVADYFSMLRAELSQQLYIKSHHSSVLMEQIGRTHRSVELKHQNISAVLEEMGCLGSLATNQRETIRRRFLVQLTDTFRRMEISLMSNHLQEC